MDRVLLGRANSSNVMKVIWLLEELGLTYERQEVGGPFGYPAHYRAMNPNGVVPTLVEDGWVLWESNAILRHLANTHSTPAWPAGPRPRAIVDQWMDWQHTVLGTPQSTVFQGLVRQAPPQRDAAAIDRAFEALSRHYTLLDAQVAREGWVAGTGFTLADIALGVHVHRWFSFDRVRPALPALRDWYDRLLGRPAYATHVALPMT